MANSNPETTSAGNRRLRAASTKPGRRAKQQTPVHVRRMALPTDPRLPWLLTGLLCLMLIGAIIWGFGQRDQASDARTANQTLGRELAQVRAGANATAYTLQPTNDGPANARGTAFYALTGSGMLQVAGLPAPPTGRRYQLWYFPEPKTKPIPGGTFTINDQGIGFMLIPSDVGKFTLIGISLEPAKGSQTPTGPMLVSGTVNGARG